MKKIILGIILGIGTIIPGVCTASLAVVLGVYELIIDFCSGHFTKKGLINLILISVGVMAGISGASVVINDLNINQKNIMSFLFLGFMLYGFGDYQKTVVKSNFSLLTFIYGFIAIIIFQLVFSFLKIDLNNSLTGIFLVGILVGAALILPGLSGSMILLSFGAYYKLLAIGIYFIKNFKVSFEFFFLLTFCLGLIMGIIITSIIVRKFINKNSTNFINLIFGMMGGTLFIMTSIIIDVIDSGVLIIALIFLIFGFLLNKSILKLKFSD